MLEIYNFTNDSLTLEKGYYTTIPEHEMVKNGKHITTKKKFGGGHFFSLTCSDSFIYALYTNKGKDASPYELFKGNDVFVFDWKGNPVKKIKLDHEVKVITIDEDDRCLYAICDNPDPTIVYFELDD